MKKISSYLKLKEIAIPLALFTLGLLIACISKKIFIGTTANIITMLGCLTTMGATDMLAKEITRIRMNEEEQKKSNLR